MFRWIFVSLLLSACGVAAVWMLVPHLSSAPLSPTETHPTASRTKRVAAAEREPEAAPPRPVAVAMANRTGGQAEVTIYHSDKANAQEMTEPILIPDGRLVITEKQVVPAEKDGVILFIGTELQQGEVVPPEKQLPEARLGFLAISVGNEQPQDGERFFTIGGDSARYRRVRESEVVEPFKAKLFQEIRKVRKLEVGDRVQRGQLLAVINPQKQLDEVRSKIAKINAAEYERQAAEKQAIEFKRRYQTQRETNRTTPGAIGKDAMMETWIQYEKHESEKNVKKAEIEIAQAALNAALTDLKLHEVHAAIDGKIKFIHKNHQGEAIKQHEPILEIQNPARLRVDARLEYQEALKLKEGMTAIVEPSRPEAPRLVIGGHLSTVNCVAVSKGKRPVIVSGSDDETLRGWDSVTGEKLWKVSGQHSAVRAVACTSPTSHSNLACFGCADGSVRVMDLDKPEQTPREMSERHRGPVLSVAFSPDGETIATCGDDRLIRLWKTETGSLLHYLPGHSGTVTSVQFASANRLVSAGKDNRLIVWDVEPDKPPHAIPPRFEGRGGEVLALGVSPDGKTVLFDQGKELRLLTLESQQIVGTLQNPTMGMNFSTMALFSPDGKTILTNGPAPGRLQLWRTPVTQMRGSELRSFVWNTPNGIATCGAFAPEGDAFAVTGTQDHKVLVWGMPSQQEIDSRLEARLTLVEYNLDTSSRHVKVWAELDNPGWLIPGMQATMVVLPPRK